MNNWKSALAHKFGKRSHKKWFTAALDILLVDIGLKNSCLFDHWAVTGQEMQEFMVTAAQTRLTRHRMAALSVGMDVFLINTAKPMESNTHYFVDITNNLNVPNLLCQNDSCITSTLNIFHDCVKNMTSYSLNTEEFTHIDVNSDNINPPCLFGLFLGYPAVYWYDRTISEDNCLSGVSLHLYQVIGEVKPVYNEMVQSFSSPRSHTVFSFTVPDLDRFHCVNSKMHGWFSDWKNSKPWTEMFSNIVLSESTLEPQVVCL